MILEINMKSKYRNKKEQIKGKNKEEIKWICWMFVCLKRPEFHFFYRVTIVPLFALFLSQLINSHFNYIHSIAFRSTFLSLSRLTTKICPATESEYFCQWMPARRTHKYCFFFSVGWWWMVTKATTTIGLDAAELVCTSISYVIWNYFPVQCSLSLCLFLHWACDIDCAMLRHNVVCAATSLPLANGMFAFCKANHWFEFAKRI